MAKLVNGALSHIPLPVDTTGHLYDDFIRLLFFYAHRESSTLANVLTIVLAWHLPSLDPRLFLVCWKQTHNLLSVSSSVPRFIRSRRPTPLLSPFLGVYLSVSLVFVLIILLAWHFLPLTLAFFYSHENKHTLLPLVLFIYQKDFKTWSITDSW